jgi:uncharacterized protein YbjT (DUF2867 family)
MSKRGNRRKTVIKSNEEKTVLVVGATGATGRLLVRLLLDRGLHVKVVVRASATLPDQLRKHDRLSVMRANLLELTDTELAALTEGCKSVASCLGHTMSWKGIFGKPRRLVTDTVRRFSAAIIARRPEVPVRFVLMSSAGCSNRDIDEPMSSAQKIVIALLRLLLPPHADNEQAADYLRTELGQANEAVEWVAVRPDSLRDEDVVTDYALHPSPIRSAIFKPGSTSRINVAHFMAALITDNETWQKWKGQMPVIYDE